KFLRQLRRHDFIGVECQHPLVDHESGVNANCLCDARSLNGCFTNSTLLYSRQLDSVWSVLNESMTTTLSDHLIDSRAYRTLTSSSYVSSTTLIGCRDAFVDVVLLPAM